MGKKKPPQKLPIFIAAERGDKETVLKIIEEIPTQLHAKNNDGWQPLHQAAFSGSLSVVKALVEAGADVGAPCKDQDTPVHYAAAQGNCSIIRYLVSRGADLTSQDRDGETPLDVTGKNKDAKKLIQALLAGEDGGDIGLEEDSDDEWETDDSEAA